jgi:rare lipoprotein A (peptidoglycan hydrolase)
MRSLVLPPALLPLLVLACGAPDVGAAEVTAKSKVAGGLRQAGFLHTHRGHANRQRAPAASGQIGMASYYKHGQLVASGGRFNPGAMTAAHPTLPFGTRVRVTHLASGRTVEVRINDRGPFIAGRILDLSKAAADFIGLTASGVARVSMTILGR